MISQIVMRDVVAHCGDQHTMGTISVHEFSAKERRARALKVALVCVCMLVAAAVIPVAHVVLVPLVLLFSPWLIYRAGHVPSEIAEISARCARCKGDLTRLVSREQYPIYERCLVCQRENRIVLAEKATSSTTL
jgi:hypothetical protein